MIKGWEYHFKRQNQQRYNQFGVSTLVLFNVSHISYRKFSFFSHSNLVENIVLRWISLSIQLFCWMSVFLVLYDRMVRLCVSFFSKWTVGFGLENIFSTVPTSFHRMFNATRFCSFLHNAFLNRRKFKMQKEKIDEEEAKDKKKQKECRPRVH